MVRSKFPGKPSKIVNRKVIKSNKYCVQYDNESSKAAENISYGLAVFNETFGDHEQVLTAFHGFSPHEVDKAKETACKQQEKVEEEYKTNGLIFPPDDAFPVKIDLPTPQELSYVATNLSVIGPVGWHTTRAQCQNLQSVNLDFSKAVPLSGSVSPMESNIKKSMGNHQQQKVEKANQDVSTCSRLQLNSQLDKNTEPNGKFVLPSRSRSSRVIKPNKRFLDADGSQKDDSLPSNTIGPSSHTRVIELKKPRLIFDGESGNVTQRLNDRGSTSSDRTGHVDASSSVDSKEHVKFADLNVFGASTSRPKRQASQSSTDGSPKKDGSMNPSTSSQISKPALTTNAVSPSRSKLILRESKLNISPTSDKLKEGLFSMKPKKGLNVKTVKSPGTTVECGVCGAVRFHRLTKQAVKFGLICCDPCRKFIAKMMLRARSSESSVPCENGQGNCALSSRRGESFANKVNRCGACWLLMCVQHLVKMPEKIRDSLIRMLPANMQGMTVVLPPALMPSPVPSNRNKRRKGPIIQEVCGETKPSPKLSCGMSTPNSSRKLSAASANKRISQTPIARIKRKAALVSLANNLRRVRDKALSAVTSSGSPKKTATAVELVEKPSKIKKLNLSKKSELHPKNSEKCMRKHANANVKTKDGQMRQKVNAKGPRVKHVCRSASIVLGQPLATFPLKSPELPISCDISDESTGTSVISPRTAQEVSRSKDCSDFKKTTDFNLGTHVVAIAEVKKLKDVSSAPHPGLPLVLPEPKTQFVSKIGLELRASNPSVPGRKVIRHPHISNQGKLLQRGYRRTLQDLEVLNQTDIQPELISLDFWESYDPDEVCNTGFGLIGFDPFLLKPMCFLCGSGGKQKLIHCASCCEPYHQFCVEMGILGGGGLLSPRQQSSAEEWRVDWVCPRCTVCHGCGFNTGHQLTACQRCHHSYHLECLGTSALRKTAGDRLWICSSCLRCKSCNSADVTKFVGNLPFCKVCFKLRQKGNFCPLCQGCYASDDYSSKMMECANCNAWVHAKCEGLSDEKYQVLSYLPESVEFICRLCCAIPPAPWWLAVEAELEAGYHNIIKAITKNRKAYAMLKWSPQKPCDCQRKSVTPALRTSVETAAAGKRRLSFNHRSVEQMENTSMVVRSLSSETSKASVASKDNPVASVFEFDDNIDAGENEPITRFTHTKDKIKSDCAQQEFHNLVVDCGNDLLEKSDKGAQFSPNAGSQSDSGVGSTDDELKTCSATEEEEGDDGKACAEASQENACTHQNSRHPLATLFGIKKKIQNCGYSSISEFHRDMDQLINEADSQDVKELYHQTLQEVFPWFDPKYHKVARNSFPMSPCKPHHGSLLQYQPNGTSPEKPNSNVSSQYILKELLPQDWKELKDEYFYCGMNLKDTRICGFCKLVGDGDSCAEGRLLYCGQNEWVHVNCALWSAEVFEEVDGALQNVSNALSRGRMIRCSECGKKGASVGCCAKKCEETLHFPCARRAGFVFMEDKNVFCSLHTKDALGKPLIKASDFDICRSVFVELDRRKKKSAESKHVRLMIGSLLVENLGTIVSHLSDQGSSIVPTEFCCTRLFWSSKEPWRIVRYTIKTTIRRPTPEPIVELGNHITVDHSKETFEPDVKPLVKLFEGIPPSKDVPIKIEEIKNKKDSKGIEKLEDVKVVEAVMNHLLDSVCSKEVDEEVTDAQNSADLLPPEVKDAIFEDLPHDLLDGISMQDIFQDKFLNFEEINKDESQDESGANKSKLDSEKTKMFKHLKVPRELKRSKSDVLPSNYAQVDSQLHQRSCSLAWSYKLGTNISCCKSQKLTTAEIVADRTKLIQELRLSMKPAPSVDMRYCLPGPGDKGKENQTMAWPRIMQVDGMAGSVLNSSDDGSDDEAVDMLPSQEDAYGMSHVNLHSAIVEDSQLLLNRIECLKTVTSAALSHCTGALKGSELLNQEIRKWKRRKVTNRKSLGRNNTFGSLKMKPIPQCDGTNEVSSDSEQEGTPSLSVQENGEEKPVRCNRCGCTYRTEESYARHLPSCSGDYSLTTSESEAEMSEEEADGTSKSVSAPSPDSAISVSSGSLSAAPAVSPTSFSPVSTTLNVILKPPPSTVTSKEVLKMTPVTVNVPPNVPPNVQHGLMQSAPMQKNIIATVSKVQKTSASKAKTMKTTSQQQTVKFTLKGNQTVLHHQQLFEQNSHQQISQHAIQQSLASAMPQQPQMITMLDYQQSQQSGPTILMQSVPSPTMVPAYLEAFQQHTGHNLQYLATVDSNASFGKTQYLAAVPSAVVPGAYQLQAISDGQLCLEPSAVGISALSGLQLAQAQLAPTQIRQTQPQVLGTLLQSPLPCGVMATTEPIYETIRMFPDQSGGMLLTSQPMLTCMETVVSNTYMSMSSSQFVSSSVPGMLQGSSTYSTTTTQVFQASKVDPPVLDVPTQYVVVNTHPPLSDATVGKLEVVSISRPQIQDQTPVQSQAQIQIPSINLPVSVKAPVPPQTLSPVISMSMVTPMPKIQPQRTYSKPSKVTKEPVITVVKKPMPVTSSAVKETMKALSNQGMSNSTKVPVSSNLSTTIYPNPSKLSELSLKSDNLVQNCMPAKTLESSPVSTCLKPSELLVMCTAPAQSITLPDPVQSKAPAANNPKILCGSTSAAAVKCPPVTFSYRTHAMEKCKPKPNLLASTSNALQEVPQNKMDGVAKVMSIQAAKQDLNGSQVQMAPDAGKIAVGLSTVTTPSQPHVVLTVEMKKPHTVKTLRVNLPSTSIEAQVDISNIKSDKADVLFPYVPISAPSLPGNSTQNSHPISALSTASKNQVGKNVSLSLMTSSLTDSVTSCTSNITASTNLSAPVSTAKLQTSTVAGLNTLKEINQTSLHVETKVCPQKVLEKSAASVPLSVLKSTSQNVDYAKKNDTFHSQGEIPIMFSNRDNSPASLKLLFQKQSHNGCYKVSSSPGKKDSQLIAVKLADISNVTNGLKDKKGGKDESENVKPVEKTVKTIHSGPPNPEIMYEIHCQDGFSYSSTSISDAWQKVFGAVQEARASHKMPPLIHNPFNSNESGHNVMGLGNNSLKYLLEQLPGVGDCRKYRPIYHKSRLPGPGYQYKREEHDLMTKESHSGCARTDPYLPAKRYDMFSWLDSRHRRPPKLLENNDIDSLTGSRRTASTSLPMAMRYRHLKETAKTSVGVFRSDIHGRGLFCLRDIEAGEMVIEYAGEVIRNTLTDNREKHYQSKGIGCYMFKVDDNVTVDATLKGNAARFINHSCEPNCYSRVVDVLGKKHIIIFAFRRIPQGEELTYDYKFPIEEEKIHCHCLSRRCRKYLN